RLSVLLLLVAPLVLLVLLLVALVVGLPGLLPAVVRAVPVPGRWLGSRRVPGLWVVARRWEVVRLLVAALVGVLSVRVGRWLAALLGVEAPLPAALPRIGAR